MHCSTVFLNIIVFDRDITIKNYENICSFNKKYFSAHLFLSVRFLSEILISCRHTREISYWNRNSINKVNILQIWRMLYSWMWRRVALVRTEVSEECIASIFRIEISASEEPEWARGLQHQFTQDLHSATSQKTPFFSHRRENLKSYIALICSSLTF
jgi:hypothetical protein